MPYRFGMNPNIFPGTGDLADCPPPSTECEHEDIEFEGDPIGGWWVCLDCGAEVSDPNEGEDVFERSLWNAAGPNPLHDPPAHPGLAR